VEITQKSEFAELFPFSGDRLTRPPKGFTKDHPLIDDLKRKDFIAISEFPHERLFEDFSGYCGEHFAKSADFMRYLCAALSLPW